MNLLSRFFALFRSRRDGVEVVIHGRHSRSWMRALGPKGPAWKSLPQVAAVRHFAPFPSRYAMRLFLPLWETSVAAVPPGTWAVVPSPRALEAFADKACFAGYAEKQGLASFIPRTLDLDVNTEFPAVLKCTDLNAGDGIAIVNSAAELAARRAEKPWAGRSVMLQSLVEGNTEYVTHLVSIGGRIRWCCTYAYLLDTHRTIRKGTKGMTMQRSEVSAGDIALFERFLGPVRYDGPANINFKRRADGSPVVFEINARFGGSLMRPEHTDDLAAALAVLIDNATQQRGHRRDVANV